MTDPLNSTMIPMIATTTAMIHNSIDDMRTHFPMKARKARPRRAGLVALVPHRQAHRTGRLCRKPSNIF